MVDPDLAFECQPKRDGLLGQAKGDNQDRLGPAGKVLAQVGYLYSRVVQDVVLERQLMGCDVIGKVQVYPDLVELEPAVIGDLQPDVIDISFFAQSEKPGPGFLAFFYFVGVVELVLDSRNGRGNQGN